MNMPVDAFFFPNVLCRFRCSRLFIGAFVGSWECSSSGQQRWHQRDPGGVGRDDLARGRGTHGVGDRLQTGW